MRFLSTAHLSSCRIFLSLKWFAVFVSCLSSGVCHGEMLTITRAAGAPGESPPFNFNGDGTNLSARFAAPGGLSLDAAGAVYTADAHALRRVSLSGTNWVVTTVTGDVWKHGPGDGTNLDARFNYPQGVAVDGAGNIFVADTYNDTLRKVTPVGTNWVVTTIAGTAGSSGSANGTNGAVQFDHPYGIAVDPAGVLYVADTFNSTIRKLVPVGTNWVSSTIAGLAHNSGTADGTNSIARFNGPSSLIVEGGTNLYVADFNNHAIRSVTLSGTNWIVKTIAGIAGIPGLADGTNSAARFYQPQGLCQGNFGNLFITDSGNSLIRKLRRAGTNWVLTTVAGSADSTGFSDGVGASALFYQPFGVAVDATGLLFIADSSNNLIRLGRAAVALDIRVAGPQLTVSWPIAATNYLLEVNANAGPSGSWPAIASGITLSGDQYSFQTNTSGGRTFFRLHKP
jgi:hypothetical protein